MQNSTYKIIINQIYLFKFFTIILKKYNFKLNKTTLYKNYPISK